MWLVACPDGTLVTVIEIGVEAVMEAELGGMTTTVLVRAVFSLVEFAG
jgi:nucleoside recognition membrane protein YjiH